VDAVIFEEDTFLVISADPVIRPTTEPLMRIMTRLIETRPEKPGTVVVRGELPLRLLAVVHDFNQEPTWKEEWVKTALEEVFRIVEDRKVTSIALPFLGTQHGSLQKERFMQLLKEVLKKITSTHLERLWLVWPPKTHRRILEILGP